MTKYRRTKTMARVADATRLEDPIYSGYPCWMKSSFSFLAISLTLGFLSSGARGQDQSSVSQEERRALIQRAQVWEAGPIASKDLLHGPEGDDAFEFDETVHCDYLLRRQSGTSAKFFCRLESGDVVKVRYGRYNNEVYGQVAGSRLLWALGFGANAQYPVRVVCHGCPIDPWLDPYGEPGRVVFFPATIERKLKGEELHEEGQRKQGWSWDELSLVDEAKGGASRAQIDALRLLGVFMSHVDSKPANQKLALMKNDHSNESTGSEGALRPFLYIHDPGSTFGSARERSGYTTLKLREWSRWGIWKDPEKCIAQLEPDDEQSGMLRDPKISEAGRQFLARLLEQLSDRQIRDLFTAAKADEVDQLPGHAGIDQWVKVFKQRRSQILHHHCPD